jgi:hypothetical protein
MEQANNKRHARGVVCFEFQWLFFWEIPCTRQ